MPKEEKRSTISTVQQSMLKTDNELCCKEVFEHKKNKNHSWHSKSSIVAANNGHLVCLEYIAKNDGIQNEPWTCAYAAKGGSLKCLKFLHKNDYKWDEWTCAFAAHAGHFDCLKFCHTNGCKWNELTLRYAADNGRFDCFEYAHNNGCPLPKPIPTNYQNDDRATNEKLKILFKAKNIQK